MPVVSPLSDLFEKPLLYTQFGMVSGKSVERRTSSLFHRKQIYYGEGTLDGEVEGRVFDLSHRGYRKSIKRSSWPGLLFCRAWRTDKREAISHLKSAIPTAQ